MKEKIFSALFRRFDMPSKNELRLVLRRMTTKEKAVLSVLVLVAGAGLLGLINKTADNFSVSVPARGGSVSEGIVGSPNLINPILAVSDTDRDMVELIYAGLMKPDGNGGLEPEMSSGFEVSEDGLLYTFKIKKDAVWHDGKPVTSEDVAFTIEKAKDSSIKSPLRANWVGVDVEIIDEKTLIFRLQKPYAPFIVNTTLGILPKHIWSEITPGQFNLSEFNRTPIGSGPYKIDDIKRNSLGIIRSYSLKAFKDYAIGRPNIEKMVLRFYPTESDMLSAFSRQEITSMGSISSESAEKIQKTKKIMRLTLPRVFGLFFNQNKSNLLQDENTRKVINLALDREKIVDESLSGFGEVLNAPIPKGAFGALSNADKNIFNIEKAKEILEKDGWIKNEETGVLEKDGQSFTFTISTSNTPELSKSAKEIKKMLEELGMKVDIRLFEIGDLNQNVIRPREYQALLFGIVVGPDPDPFAFWHSSQRNDPGLNVTLYANSKVDSLLEEARTETDTSKRKEKYFSFQEELSEEVPAVFLYSPHYLYVPNESIRGINTANIAIPAERFVNVHLWHFYTLDVLKILAD